MGLAKGAPQSLISLGAALTLHRVSRLEKKGHKNPSPPPLNRQWHWRALPLHL